MTFESLAEQLPLGDFDASFPSGWELSEQGFPKEGLSFLQPETIARYGKLVRLPGAAVEAMIDAARSVSNHEATMHLLWHEHTLLRGGIDIPKRRRRSFFLPPGTRPHAEPESPEIDPCGFPNLGGERGRGTWTFNLLLALSLLPDALWFYDVHHIPEDIREATLSDFSLLHGYFDEHFACHGITLSALQWLTNHLHGRLFRIGRLQFMRGELGPGLTVYRNVTSLAGRSSQPQSGIELAILAPAGMGVERGGLYPAQAARIPGVERELPPEPAFRTTRSHGEDWIAGNPILQDGRIDERTVHLPMDQWRLELERGSGVLEIHIPGDGPLDPAACAASVSRAVEFFREYFPERRFRALSCESWFLDPSLDAILDGGSNLRRFARSLHRYPVEGSEEEGLRRIFGNAVLASGIYLSGGSTSLQRGAAELLRRGGYLRPGGGFLLTEELPWGALCRSETGRAVS